MDFGASLTHTHHKEAIFSFAELLASKHKNFEIWLPVGSEVRSEKFEISYNLTPGFNPVSFNLKKILTWLPGIHGKIHNFANKYNLKLILKALLFLNAAHFFILVKKKSQEFEEINIIFTTMCGFSFKALNLLESKKIKIKSFCRLTNTAERRGAISKLARVEDFIEITKSFRFVETRFGTETFAYMRKIGLSDDARAFISKFPARQKIIHKETDATNVTISFLGYPTRDKGQENIVPLIGSAVRSDLNLNWKVQVSENDPIVSKLSELNAQIEILVGKISAEKMNDALLGSTLICLPYNPIAFAFNSSAMMYQATDYLLPVMTFSGSAFAEEVDLFQCGIVAQNLEDLIEKIHSFQPNHIPDWISGCVKYNEFRNTSNSVFLNLI